MNFSGLLSFVQQLEKQNELIRISDFVNPKLEITEIADRFSKQPDGGKALYFEKTGTDFPLLINALGSEKRIAIALGRASVFDLETEIDSLFKQVMQPKENLWDKLKILPRLKEVSQWMPKKINGKGTCQQVVMDKPDITRLPVLTCWPADEGPFVTLPGVHTVDPETGASNVGMYRMQVFEKNMTGMHWHRHKTGANHFEKYKRLKQRMPISVALGGDPVYTYAATAPMPENMDEYLLAGFLRKKRVKLVKCLTNDLFVPEDADFVIEGYVDPSEDFIWEGPFGDHTGFYSLADWYPRFHITAITHRKDAVYPATIVGVPPMEDAYIGLATERIFLSPMRMAMVPELKDMSLPVAGTAHNFAVVKIGKSYPGQAIKVMSSLWGAGQMMFNKVLIVTDASVDIQDSTALLKAFTEKFSPQYSLHFSKGPLDILDHSSQKFAFGSKVGIDLTTALPEEIDIQQPVATTSTFNPNTLSKIPEIKEYRDLRETLSLPVLLLKVAKNSLFSKEKLIHQLLGLQGIENFKLVIYFNDGVSLDAHFILMWLLGGNLDPARDITLKEHKKGQVFVAVDATFKTAEHDKFAREWPNIVTMDDTTIAKIDSIWEKLCLGPFISSPSIPLKPLIKGTGAIKE